MSPPSQIGTEVRGVFAILSGRWQPPHLGHVWIVEHILTELNGDGSRKVEQLVLGIVNPDPSRPPDPKFRKFVPSANPLSYWERSEIWTDILARLGLLGRVTIVPMWHPRASLRDEESYLPPKRQRYWIVPLLDEEERAKAEDFCTLGEDVRGIALADIPAGVSCDHSIEVRRKILTRNESWKEDVPETVVDFFAKHGIEDRIRRLYSHEMMNSRFRIF